MQAAQAGYKLKELVNDHEEDVRATVANQGYDPDQLATDHAAEVRAAVARTGYQPEDMAEDESWKVRNTVAQSGNMLEELSEDPVSTARKTVARQGACLDKLVYDPHNTVKQHRDIKNNTHRRTVIPMGKKRGVFSGRFDKLGRRIMVAKQKSDTITPEINRTNILSQISSETTGEAAQNGGRKDSPKNTSAMKPSVEALQSRLAELERSSGIIKKLLEIAKKSEDETIDLLSQSNADFFAFLSTFPTPQSKSTPIENFIISKIGGVKVKASEDRGDFTKDGKFFEVKASTTNTGNNLNIRQIRPWQDVDYYVCAFIEENNLVRSKVYVLTKEQMLSEIEECGGYTHGTSVANKSNKNLEYSITVQVFNKSHSITARWDENYLNDEYYATLFNDN